MKTTTIALWTLCGMAGLLAGCGGNYYKVNDPAGDRQYYTTDIDQTKTGAISFNALPRLICGQTVSPL